MVSCLGLAIALRGVHLKDLGMELSTLPWAMAILLGSVSFLGTAMRAYRWKIGVESFSPATYRNVFSAFLVGLFGLNVIPARVGELLRVLVLAKNSSVSHSATLATVVFERVVDGLVLIVLFATCLWFYPAADPESLFGASRKPYLMMLPVIFIGVFLMLILFWRHPDASRKLMMRIFGKFGKLGEKFPGMLDRFAGGLVIFSDRRRMIQYIAWSFGAWIMYGLYFLVNFKMLGINLGLGEAMVALSVTAVGAMIPAAPGFVGTYHAFCKAGLMAFGVSDTRALAFAFVTHIVPYFIHTLAGFICALRENIRWSDLSQPAEEK